MQITNLCGANNIKKVMLFNSALPTVIWSLDKSYSKAQVTKPLMQQFDNYVKNRDRRVNEGDIEKQLFPSYRLSVRDCCQ